MQNPLLFYTDRTNKKHNRFNKILKILKKSKEIMITQSNGWFVGYLAKLQRLKAVWLFFHYIFMIY